MYPKPKKRACLTLYGMVQELMLNTKISIRTSSRVSHLVDVVDNILVVLTAAVGFYGAPRRMKRLFKIMETVSSVDTHLGVEYSITKERNYCVGIFILIIFWTCLLFDDFWVYLMQAQKFNRQSEIINNFIAFYLLNYIAFILELQFSYTAWIIQERLRQIKDALGHIAEAVKADVKIMNKNGQKSTINAIAVAVSQCPVSSFDGNRPPAQKIGTIVDSLKQYPHPTLLLTKEDKLTGLRKLLVSPAEAVKKLSELHGNMSLAIDHANIAYGHPLLIILLSTLMHLIVTWYFIILQLGSSELRLHFTSIQFMWCIAHALRLLVIVEPCHRTSHEAQKVKALACQMLGYMYETNGTGCYHAVDLFARQVTMRSLDFTALGILILSRPLVASIAGAVTTYLVILIQFQNDNKK